MEEKINATEYRHNHDGITAERILFKNLVVPNKQTLTPKNTNGLTSGGANPLTTSDSNIIQNMRDRIDELEAILKSLNLLN